MFWKNRRYGLVVMGLLVVCLFCITSLLGTATKLFAQQDQPPVVAPISDQHVLVGQSVTVAIVATDADGDSMLIQLIDQPPPGVNFSDAGNGNATLTWTPTQAQKGTHTFRVQAVDSQNPAATSAIVGFTIEVGDGPDLVVQKSRRETYVYTNSRANFDVTIENKGDVLASNVIITDVLSGLAKVSFSAVLVTGGQGTCEEESSTYRCTFGAIPAGGKVTILSSVFVGEEVGEFVNSVIARSTLPDVNQRNNSASVTTKVTPPNYADLAVVAQRAPNPAEFDPFSYAVDVVNLGNSAVPKASMVFTLDGPGYFTSWASKSTPPEEDCTVNSRRIVCTIFDFQPGVLSVPVPISAGIEPIETGAIHLTVNITSNLHDPDPANNAKEVTVEVVPATIDLSIAKAGSATVAQVGDQLTYSLLVQNLDTDRAFLVALQDTLPAGMHLVKILPTRFVQCRILTARMLECKTTYLYGKSLERPKDNQFIVKYIAQVDAAGQLTNRATVNGAYNTDPAPDNNTATHTVTVTPAQKLIGTVTIGGSQPITPTAPITDTGGSFSEIPIKIITDGETREVTTNEFGQASLELGDAPQQIAISTSFTRTLASDISLQFDLNQMPPAGNAQITATVPISTNVLLNTRERELQQLPVIDNTFAWEDRTDVTTATFDLTIPSPPDPTLAASTLGVAAEGDPVEIELVINTQWARSLYLPLIQR